MAKPASLSIHVRVRASKGFTEMRKFLTVAAAVAATIGLSATALAVSGTMGNDAIDRNAVDSYQNFTIVDTNKSAPFDGYFTAVNYYAERSGVIRFVVVAPDDTVTWISDEITATVAGFATATFGAPVGVTAGDNLGVYSRNAGVVSFDYDQNAAPAEYTPNNVGLPVVGETLLYEGASERFYSMNATIQPSSPDICKNGGWESFGYKNQGQCIASIVANENAGK